MTNHILWKKVCVINGTLGNKEAYKSSKLPSAPQHEAKTNQSASEFSVCVCVRVCDGEQNTWSLNVFRLCAAGSIYSLMLHNMTFCKHSSSFKGSSVEKKKSFCIAWVLTWFPQGPAHDGIGGAPLLASAGLNWETTWIHHMLQVTSDELELQK